MAGRSDTTWGSPVRAYTAGDDAFAAKIGELSVLEIPTVGGAGLALLVLLLAAAAMVALRWGAAA